MIDDLISRKALFNELFVRNGKVCPNHDIDNFPIRFNVKDIKQTIRNAPTAYDVDKVVEQLEDLKRRYWFTIANTGNEKLDCAYENAGNALDRAIEIVKSGGATND